MNLNPYESDQTIGPHGVMNVENLPFAEGQKVHVRIEPVSTTGSSARKLGLHQGSVWMSDDFDAPLPDAFWLGMEGRDERTSNHPYLAGPRL